MIDYELDVLAGIIPERKDLLMFADQHLELDHFKTEVPRNVFRMVRKYYELTGGVLPITVLSDLLQKSQDIDSAKALTYEGYYVQIASHSISDHEFKYAVDALKERHSDQMTGEAMVSGFEIFQRGLEVDGLPLKGAKEAREYVYQEFAKIDRLDLTDNAPEGDMRFDGASMWQNYLDRKSGKIGQGVLSGISSFDAMTGGFHNGELSLFCAYTNQGKTQFCTQTAWHTAVVQGQGVFFATSETVREVVLRRIYARHSRLPQFEMPQGLDSEDIKRGSLTPKQETVLKAVMDDFHTNPNYAPLYIAQIPSGATNTYVEQRMKRAATEFHVALGVWDYLALFKATVRRQGEREEFNQVIREAKTFSVGFDDGRGVPIISPWQIKQSEFMNACRNGYYTLGSLADTSEAEKSPDGIYAMLRMPESKHEAMIQVLKARDSDIPSPITVNVDFRSTYLGDHTSAGTTAGAGFFA